MAVLASTGGLLGFPLLEAVAGFGALIIGAQKGPYLLKSMQ